MPKIHYAQDGIVMICENCCARSKPHKDINKSMREAVQTDGWAYRWHHGVPHYAEFFCPKCKSEFAEEAV